MSHANSGKRLYADKLALQQAIYIQTPNHHYKFERSTGRVFKCEESWLQQDQIMHQYETRMLISQVSWSRTTLQIQCPKITLQIHKPCQTGAHAHH